MCFLNPFSSAFSTSGFTSPDRPRPDPGPLAQAANERHRQLVRFNESPCATVSATSIPEFVATQAARFPEAPAVRRGDEIVSYRSMIERAKNVSHVLRASGVTKGDEVGMCVGSGPDLPSVMLGVWGVGAISVPLPFGPECDDAIEREDVSAILAARTALNDLPVHLRERAICLERALEATPARTLDSWEEPVEAGDPALVALTAGGGDESRDIVTHRAVLNWISWYQGDFPREAGFHTLQWAKPLDSLFIHELASAWSTGGCLWIPDCEGGVSVDRLVECTATMPVQRLVLSSSFLPDFARAVRGGDAERDQLREITAVGSPVGCRSSIDAVSRGRNDWRLNTLSGPCDSLLCIGNRRTGPAEMPEDWSLIGRPLPDARAYVLDHGQRLVPTGTPGELYLGGRFVTDGARPGGTTGDSARWMGDPFSEEPGALLYRTGQRARFLEDGTLEIFGPQGPWGDGTSQQARSRVALEFGPDIQG